MYLFSFSVMMNYPAPINNTYQVKIGSWSKVGHKALFGPPCINSKPNLRMKPNTNIVVVFSIL